MARNPLTTRANPLETLECALNAVASVVYGHHGKAFAALSEADRRHLRARLVRGVENLEALIAMLANGDDPHDDRSRP